MAVAKKLDELQIQTLQTREEAREGAHQTREEARQIREEARQIRAAVAKLEARQLLSSPSRAELGRSIWEACQSKSEGIAEAVRHSSPTPFLSPEDHLALKAQYKLHSGSQENVWVALLTPRLMELVATLSPNKVLVNSELIGWIRTEAEVKDFFQKPDLFVCDPVAFLRGEAPRTSDKSSASSKYAASLRTDAFLFGSCAWPLRDAVLCLFEAKVKIDLHEAIGEVFSKAQNLLRGTTMAALKCCLFDMEVMYLLSFTSTGLLSSQRFPLHAPGSFQAIANFVLPPSAVEPGWLRTTRQLCAAFNVAPVLGAAFLGSGAHGKVFRVQSLSAAMPASSSAACLSASAASVVTTESASSARPASTFALKVVDRRHQDSLDAEHLKLQRLLSSAPSRLTCLPSFVSPVVSHATDRSGEPLGSGLLLQPVGEWVWAQRPSNSQSVFSEVLDALLQLHQFGVVHGDARLENLVRVDGGRLVWIDFRECQIQAEQELQRWWDLRTCLQNFARHHHRSTMEDTAFGALRSQYAAVGAALSHSAWEDFKRAAWKEVIKLPSVTCTHDGRTAVAN